MKKHCKGCSNKPHSQDELHGKGVRIFNESTNKNRQRVLRCTVCGNEEFQAAPAEAPKKGEKPAEAATAAAPAKQEAV